MTKKKLTEKQKKARAAAAAKRMTVGKGLKIWAISGGAIDPALAYMTSKNPKEFTRQIPFNYSGFDTEGVEPWRSVGLAKGYGGGVMSVVEKKVFRALRVRGPRTKMETFGDALDYLTYFGVTAQKVYENRGDNREAHRQAYKTQFGIDLQGSDWATTVVPLESITQKWVPYLAQKYARKLLRAGNIKMPSFLGVGR